MRADTLTDTFTALRELPRAVLHSVAPAVPRPVRHALRSGQRAMQLSQRVAWYSLLSALVLLAPPSRAQSADAENTKAESPYFFVKGAQPGVDALPLKSTDVQVNISGVIADVVVTQRYKNEGTVPIEARYIFPGSTKAPDALLKKGYSQIEMGQAGAGKQTLNQLINDFPGTDASRLADGRLRALGVQ